MTIDFKAHLLKTLQTTNIYHYNLPDIEVINEDKDFALAVWKSYTVDISEYQNLTLEKWYNNTNWKTNLYHYRENTEFWEQALEKNNFKCEILLYKPFQKDFPVIIEHYKKNITLWENMLDSNSAYYILLQDDFKAQFPIIADYYLKDNKKLEQLYYKAKDKNFFNLIDLPIEQKEKIEQYYYLETGAYISKEFISKYEDDDVFVKKLLSKHSDIFPDLNETNRDNFDYIKLAFNRSASTNLNKIAANFYSLSKERREQHFSAWFKIYVFQIAGSDLGKLSLTQVKEVFKTRNDLLDSALIHHADKYGSIAVELLKEDFNKYIPYMNQNMLKKFYKSEEDIIYCKEYLQNYIEAYFMDKKLSKKDNSMLYLISLDQQLQKNLENSVGYKIHNQSGNLSKEQFFIFVDQIIENNKSKKMDEILANRYINKLKIKLDTETLKDLKIPKENSFNYLTMLRLNEKLHNTIPLKEHKAKNKI